MFCDRCGTELGEGQRLCGRCGKPVAIAFTPGMPSRVRQHIHLAAILLLAYSAFTVIGGGTLFILANTLFVHIAARSIGDDPGSSGTLGFLPPLMNALAGLLVLKGIAGLIAGVGLLQRLPWARPAALVIACVALINIPFGTALGVYILWVLLAPTAAEDYELLNRGAA